MSEDSEDLAFLNHVILRDQNISCNHSPLRLKFISQLLIALICMCAAETDTILIVFGYPYHSFSF